MSKLTLKYEDKFENIDFEYVINDVSDIDSLIMHFKRVCVAMGFDAELVNQYLMESDLEVDDQGQEENCIQYSPLTDEIDNSGTCKIVKKSKVRPSPGFSGPAQVALIGVILTTFSRNYSSTMTSIIPGIAFVSGSTLTVIKYCI